MKKVLSLVLALCLMTSAFVFTAQAANAVVFSVNVEADQSGNVNLVFSLNSGTNLGAFKLSVAYDPAKLQISGDSSEAFAGHVNDVTWAVNTSKYNQNLSGNTASESKVIVTGLCTNTTSGIAGGGRFFTLKFKVKSGVADGSTVVRIIKGDMALVSGSSCSASAPDSITLDIVNGNVTNSSSSTLQSNVILNFDSTSNFTTAFATSKAIENSEKKEGAGSMRMGFNSPTGQNASVGGYLLYDFSTAQDLSKYDSFSMNIYTPLAMEGKGGVFQVNFVTSTSGEDGFNFDCDISNIYTGWNTISFNKNDPSATVSGANWSSIKRIRLIWFNYSQVSRQFFLLDNLVGYYGNGGSSSTVTPPSVSSDVPVVIPSTPDASNAFDQWISFTNETHHSWTFVENNYSNISGQHATIAQEFVPARQYISGGSLRLFLSGSSGYVRFSIRTNPNDAATEIYGNNYLYGGANTNTWCVADFTSDNDGNNSTVKVTPGQKYYLVYYYVLLNDNNVTCINVLDNVGSAVDNCAWVKVYPNSTFTRQSTWIAPFDIHYDTAVENAANLINAIGIVSAGSGTVIANARSAYNSLTKSQQKALTSELSTLQAAENAFNALPKAYGDLTGDGIVHASDALTVLNASVGKVSLSSSQQILANVDGTAGISANDAATILQFSIGKIGSFSSVTTTANSAYSQNYNPPANASYKATATIGKVQNVASGQQIKLPVTLSSVSNGYAYVTIAKPTYDSSLLEFVGFEAGSNFSSATKTYTSNMYALMPTITNSSQSSNNSSGQVANLVFKAKSNINTTTTVTAKVVAGVYTSNNWKTFDTAVMTTVPGGVNPPNAPTFTISSTNNLASSQTMTLTITSAVGVAGYYWGTSDNYADNTFVSTTSTSPTRTVNSSGTRYIVVKDKFGNLSAAQTITYHKTTLDANGGVEERTSILTQSGKSFTFPTYSRTGYDFNGWSTDKYATSGITSLNPVDNSTYYAVWVDNTKPTATVTSTNNVAPSQTVTYTLSDNDSIAGYYFGTSSDYNENPYTISSETTIVKEITQPGTYYLKAQDKAGNHSVNAKLAFYSTTFIAEGATINGADYVITANGNSFTTPIPSKAGYEFKGWSTDANATSGVTAITPQTNETYYAIWADITNPTASIVSTNDLSSSQTLTLTFFDNEGIQGYYFGKDSQPLDANFVSTTELTHTVIVSESGTYYLFVKDAGGNISEAVTITFYMTTLNANGGNVDVTSILTKAGNSIVFPEAVKDGYILKGWAIDANATSGDNFITPVADNTYYAIWADNSAPVISVESTNDLANSQTITITVTDNGDISGYYFGTSASYEYNAFFSTTEKLIEKLINAPGVYYIAIEDANGNISNTVSITFYETLLDAMGGEISIESILTKAGNTIELPLATKDGYTFIGWSTDPNVSSDATSITPLANDTYYAIWEDNIKPVGSINATNDAASSQSVIITMTDNESVAGYYFGNSENYLDNPYFIAVDETFATLTVSDSGTYYLTVVDATGNVSETVSITFFKTILNAVGGSVSTEYILTKEGASVNLPTPEYYGYDFKGWSTDVSASEGVFAITPNANNTYYAIWDRVKGPEVSITNTNNIANTQTIKVETSDDIVGYWWGTSPFFANNQFFEANGNIEFIVNTAGTYFFTALDSRGIISETKSVKFHEIVLYANGGALDNSLILAEDGVEVTLPVSTKGGYIFGGWGYGNSASFGVNKIVPTQNTTLYALWTKNIKPSISIDVSNNLADNQDVTINVNSEVGIKGYYFGTSLVYGDNEFIETSDLTIIKNVSAAGTYYITVRDNDENLSATVAVTFYETLLNGNGGTANIENVLTKAGNTIKLPTATNNGFIFNGWSSSNSATSGISKITPNANTTLYAVWVENIQISATVGTNYIEESDKYVKIPVSIGNWANSYATITINGITYDSALLKFDHFEIPENNFISSLVGNVVFDNESMTYTIINTPDNADNATNTSGGEIAYLVFEVLGTITEESYVSVSFDASQTSVYLNGEIDNWTEIVKVNDINVTTGFVAPVPDTEKPVGSMTATNNFAPSQDVTILMSDNEVVLGYYFGTSANYEENEFFEASELTAIQTVTEPGTYYLFVMDAAGNISDVKTITFYKLVLDANGGTFDIPYVIVEANQSFTLPVLQRDRFKFNGWSTDINADKGENTFIATENTTYYAIWIDEAAKAKEVEALINAIGKVTLLSGDAIYEARNAYDTLPDDQKLFVNNLAVLEEAERVYSIMESCCFGDINNDGSINVLDALSALHASVGKIQLDEYQSIAADVDGSGVVDVMDTLYILQYSVNKIHCFPIEDCIYNS
ncbi:MAG: InlB B-repeat-containing protein [Clostridia bacterium]|nr:InlB B-repeat-containing protein [Clostridia bacterium]